MSYDSIILGDSPVAYLELNETTGTVANDATGNGHDGTHTGSYTLAGAVSPIGDAAVSMAGTGIGSHVGIPDDAALEIIGELTLECLAQWTSDGGPAVWIAVAAKGDSSYRMAQSGGSSNQVMIDSWRWPLG